MTRGGEAVHTIKIRRCFAQDLVGLAQFTVLALQRLQAICHLCRHTGPLAAVDLRLLDPLEQSLGNAADLLRDRHDGRPARRMVALVVQHHAHRTGADLRRKLVRRFAHIGSTFSKVGASGKPGAVQTNALSRSAMPKFRSQDRGPVAHLVKVIGPMLHHANTFVPVAPTGIGTSN